MADNKKARVKVAVTNNDVGPRFINTLRGQETVRAGVTLETEMSQVQIESLDDEFVTNTDDAPRWTVDQVQGDLSEAANKGKALTDLPVAKLRSIAEAEGVTLTGRKDPASQTDLPDLTKAADIAAAIQAHRDANPS